MDDASGVEDEDAAVVVVVVVAVVVLTAATSAESVDGFSDCDTVAIASSVLLLSLLLFSVGVLTVLDVVSSCDCVLFPLDDKVVLVVVVSCVVVDSVSFCSGVLDDSDDVVLVVEAVCCVAVNPAFCSGALDVSDDVVLVVEAVRCVAANPAFCWRALDEAIGTRDFTLDTAVLLIGFPSITDDDDGLGGIPDGVLRDNSDDVDDVDLRVCFDDISERVDVQVLDCGAGFVPSCGTL